MAKKTPWDKTRSIKDTTTIKTKVSGLDKYANLGYLMRKYPALEEELYALSTSANDIFDDMDLTIEEFSEITAVDMDQLMEVIEKVMKTR